MMNVSEADRTRLRSLAGRLAELSRDETMQPLRKRWADHNALREGRPMIVCSPEGAWGELIHDEELTCSDPLLRRWERNLLSRLFEHDHIGDDTPVDDQFCIGWQTSNTGYGVEIPKVFGDNRGSFVWDPPIKDLKGDFEKLHHRQFSVDRQATYDMVEQADR